MSAEVFISYATRDRERVLSLVERLRGAGVTVWIDQAGIDVSTMWSQEIVSAIKSCKVMLLSISPNSTESENVVKELALASERKKPIIPVYLETAEIPETMEYQLAGIQRVEYFREKEDLAFKAMLRSLVKRGVHVDDEKSTENDLDEGLVSSLASHNPSIEKTSSKKEREIGLLTPILVLAIIGLILALFLKPGNENKPPISPVAKEQNVASKTSIAVLPFRNIGPADTESFLADGMHDEIDAMLSMTPSLTVKNASRLRDSLLDPKSAGEALKVDSVLTGTVRQAGGQLRVTVKLIDTKSEENIWASTFDKSESDVFSVQREIAEKVVDGLKLELGQGQEAQLAKRQPKNLEAYNLFLQGRKMWGTRTNEGMRGAIEKYELALAKDPTFALAHVGIADAYIQLAGYMYSPPKISYPKAKLELTKALEINPNLSEGHASMAWLKCHHGWDWAGAEQSFKKAILINPNNPEAHRWYSHMLFILNRTKESHAKIDRGIELEPESPIMQWGKVNTYIHEKKYAEAIISAKKTISLDEKYVSGLYGLSMSYLYNGDLEDALKTVKEGLSTFGDHPFYLTTKAEILAAMNRQNEIETILNDLIEKEKDRPVSKTNLALVNYLMGRDETALSLLERAFEEQDLRLLPVIPQNRFTRFNGNPRFEILMQKVGLIDLK